MKDINVPTQVAILQGEFTQREKNEATRQLVNRFNRTLFYFILKMVHNQEDAEDILQQVWTKAFSRIAQYKPAHAFSTWLFKIATNQVIDENRKRTLDIVSLDTPLTNETKEGDQVRSHNLLMSMADYAPTPDEQMQLNARKEICWKLVEMLSPRLKKLVVLRYMKQFSYEEIAEETGLPLGTVKATLFRARTKLEAFAQDYQLEERY